MAFKGETRIQLTFSIPIYTFHIQSFFLLNSIVIHSISLLRFLLCLSTYAESTGLNIKHEQYSPVPEWMALKKLVIFSESVAIL